VLALFIQAQVHPNGIEINFAQLRRIFSSKVECLQKIRVFREFGKNNTQQVSRTRTGREWGLEKYK
jgi:hypothetical protein